MNKGIDRRETAQSHSNKLFLASKAAPSSRRDMTATDTETDSQTDARSTNHQRFPLPPERQKGRRAGPLADTVWLSYLPRA